jgi:hypothetical protein
MSSRILLAHDTIRFVRFVSNSQDVVRGVSVQGLLEQLLVEEVTDETGRSSENEQTVETAACQ